MLIKNPFSLVARILISKLLKGRKLRGMSKLQSPIRPKGPSSQPSITSKTEEFLKTILPFKAVIDGLEIDVIHIDKYLFVIREKSGSIGLAYKTSFSTIWIDKATSLKVMDHLAV